MVVSQSLWNKPTRAHEQPGAGPVACTVLTAAHPAMRQAATPQPDGFILPARMGGVNRCWVDQEENQAEM